MSGYMATQSGHLLTENNEQTAARSRDASMMRSLVRLFDIPQLRDAVHSGLDHWSFQSTLFTICQNRISPLQDGPTRMTHSNLNSMYTVLQKNQYKYQNRNTVNAKATTIKRT